MKYIDFFRKVRLKVNAYRVSPREKCVLITDQAKPEDLVFQIKNAKSLNIQVVGCIGRHIKRAQKKTHEGVHYYDHLTHLPRLIYKKNPSMIVICFAKPNSSALKNLIDICQEKDLRIKKLCKEERQGEQGSHLRLRPIEPEELLGRASISLDTFSIGNMVKSKVILITGAGVPSALKSPVKFQNTNQSFLFFLRSQSFFFIIWNWSFKLISPKFILFLFWAASRMKKGLSGSSKTINPMSFFMPPPTNTYP